MVIYAALANEVLRTHIEFNPRLPSARQVLSSVIASGRLFIHPERRYRSNSLRSSTSLKFGGMMHSDM